MRVRSIDRIVDGDAGGPREGVAVEPKEDARSSLAPSSAHLAASRTEGSRVASSSRNARAKHEDAAVPVVAAGVQVGGRCGAGRLLHEGVDGKDVGKAAERVAAADVAVARVRGCRSDAEEHEPASRCHLGGSPDRGNERRLVLDDMVRWHHHQDAVGVVARDQQRGDCDRRRRVAGDRLQHDRFQRAPGKLRFLLDQESVIVVADDDGRREFQPWRASRLSVAARKLDPWSWKERMNCLGYMARDSGHRRVPEPPERTSGRIEGWLAFCIGVGRDRSVHVVVAARRGIVEPATPLRPW